MIRDIYATLCAVDEFIQATDSLAKAMTIAVTIREVAKVIILN